MLPFPLKFYSPAIGIDGTVYIVFQNYSSSSSYVYAIYPSGILKWKYKTEAFIEASPSIGNDGTIYVAGIMGGQDGHLYAISSKIFLNTAPWPQYLQNNLHTGLQIISPELQLFDLRYLILQGTLTMNSSSNNLKITTIIQNQFFLLSITLINGSNCKSR